MPVYEYQCDSCGDRYEPFLDHDSLLKDHLDSGTSTCHDIICPGRYRRRFSFSSPSDPVGDGYFDHSAGTYVTSKRQLDEVNKVRSAEVSERMGLEHRFVAREVGDVTPPTLPDAG